MTNRIAILFFSFFFLTNIYAQEGYKINVKIKGYSNDTITIANYLMDKQYLRDTAVYDSKTSSYTFAGDTPLQAGMYLIVLPPDNNYFQILINEDEEFFDIETAPDDFAKNMKIKGSADNELFYDYLNFLGEQRPISTQLQKDSEAAQSETEKEAIKSKQEALNAKVEAKQLEIIEKYPLTLTAALIKANRNPPLPEFEGEDETELQTKRWQWTKQHYFDNIQLNDPRFLRMPFLFQRVSHYVEKLTVQHPDSISQSLFRILDDMQGEGDNFKYYLVHYLNEYAKSKVVGFDAIYVALVERYYKTGKASWTDEEQLKKIIKNSDTLKPLLLGKIAPNIAMETKDAQKISLHEVESPYTVLIFWDPECGHCKKSMPALLDFHEKFKDRGVEIMAVCTRFMKETEQCWDFIEEKEIGVWLNVVDPYHRSKYKLTYDIRSTPQIYILDSKKEIISKKIGSEQLEEIMDQIILQEQQQMSQGK